MKRSFEIGLASSAGIGLMVVAGVIASGCGGGAGTAVGGSSGGSTSQTLGTARASYIGHPKAQVSTGSNGVSVSGLSGAAFTYIDIYPQKVLANTLIAYALGGQIWTYNWMTGESNMITALTGNAGFSGGPSWTSVGHLVFSTTKANGAPLATYTCRPDGSVLTKLPSAANAVVQRPAFSPGQNYIAGYNATNDLCVEANNGASPTLLVSHTKLDQVGSVSWLNSSTILFQENVSGTEQLFQVSNSGTGTPTQLAGFTNATSGTYDLQAAISSDGTTIAYNSGGASTPATTIVNLTNGSSLNVTSPGMNYLYPTIAPNNTEIAYWGENQGASSNDGSYGIYSALINGQNPEMLASDPYGTGGPYSYTSSYPNWQPFPTYQRMVGTSAPYGTTASGYFLSQDGDAFSSFLSFTAATPSKVVVTPPTATYSQSALVYTVTADSISSIVWSNGYYVPPTNQALTGATGFLVSFSSSTGQVGFVSTFEGPTGQVKKLAASKAGSQMTYSGNFKSVYDAAGHNLAPNGASTLVIDAKTGKLVNFM